MEIHLIEPNVRSKERRASSRIPFGIETTYQSGDKTSPSRLAMSQDVSLDGMRLSQVGFLPMGQAITVGFAVPGQGQLIFEGIVVWCREIGKGQGGFQAGIRWTSPPAAMQAKLNAFYVDRIHQELLGTSSSERQANSIQSWWTVVAVAVIGFAALIFSNLFSWFNRSRMIR